MSGKIEIIKQWIEKADHDLGTAQLTFIHIPKYTDTIAFHIQQAVEKYLKGYLIYLDIPFKRQHSLNYLLSLISQKVEISMELFDSASELEDFAVEIRYPDSFIEISDEDIARSLKVVKVFRNFVLSKMNLTIEFIDLTKE